MPAIAIPPNARVETEAVRLRFVAGRAKADLVDAARPVDCLASIRKACIDGPREFRRLRPGNEIFEPLIALYETAGRHRSDADRRGRDDRVKRLRLAGRVIKLPLAAAEAPNRREIGIAGR